MRMLLAAVALAALGACATNVEQTDRVDWRCANGAAFSVRFENERAEVFAGGQTYSLPAVVSASGSRYSDGTVEYWEHQGEATLTNANGGPYTGCHQN